MGDLQRFAVKAVEQARQEASRLSRRHLERCLPEADGLQMAVLSEALSRAQEAGAGATEAVRRGDWLFARSQANEAAEAEEDLGFGPGLWLRFRLVVEAADLLVHGQLHFLDEEMDVLPWWPEVPATRGGMVVGIHQTPLANCG